MKRFVKAQAEKKAKRVVISHKSDPKLVKDVILPPCTVDPKLCDPPNPIGTWKEKHMTISSTTETGFKICAWNVNGS